HHIHVLVWQHGGDVHACRVQTKKGLPVFLGSLRSRKSMTFAEISSSTVFDRSNVNGPSSLQVWFAAVPSEDLHHSTGRSGVRHDVVIGSTAPGTSGNPGIGVFLHGGAKVCSVGVLLMSGKLTPRGTRAPWAGRRCDRLGGSCRTRRCCSQDRAKTMQLS